MAQREQEEVNPVTGFGGLIIVGSTGYVFHRLSVFLFGEEGCWSVGLSIVLVLVGLALLMWLVDKFENAMYAIATIVGILPVIAGLVFLLRACSGGV